MKPPAPAPPRDRTRLRLQIRGAVQGVGFRPFLFRLASELHLAGWVGNSSHGVVAEVEGPAAAVNEFALRLERERPPRSFIQSQETTHLDPAGYADFTIRASEIAGPPTALVLPDIATCPDCLREVFDPANRRHRYPFTNCTNCGPRFSLIEALPYDRANTSMRRFTMCPACQAEYDDPRDRRFHAQPNACPVCGPQLALWDRAGRTLASGDAALCQAAGALRGGGIVAVKGLGGFHLLVRAADDVAVRRLRQLKHREEKPFALMAASLAAVERMAFVSELEARALQSPEAPIVLLDRREPAGSAAAAGGGAIAPAVAPGNPCLGVMLPATPLHHLLLAAVGEVVVATSGNLSDEPICTDEHEALARLGRVADLFLVHDRPVVRHVDDSIVRVVLEREQVLRRARGFAPLPVPVPDTLPETLAVGAHLKNTVALARGGQVFVSQHIGDLATAEALRAFEQVIGDLSRLYALEPVQIAADLHPDYLSTKHALKSGRAVVGVQHHFAHVLACMAENEVPAPALGVAWDGTGLGLDGTIWGGEFLHVTPETVARVGHLRTFRLPGGDQAVKEPRRSALGLLFEWRGDEAFSGWSGAALAAFTPAERETLRRMLQAGLNSPPTSSVGRLFDAVASLAGLRQVSHFEGQAAMELEFAGAAETTVDAYPLPVRELAGAAPSKLSFAGNCEPFAEPAVAWVLDWAPMIEALLNDVAGAVPAARISAKFHNALAAGIVAVAQRVNTPRVVLTGGCFQNRCLLARSVKALRVAGFSPYWHQRIPPNDGGVALGQAVGAGRVWRRQPSST